MPDGRAAARAAAALWRALRARPRAALVPVVAGAALAIALAAGWEDDAEPARASAVPFDGRSPLAPEGPRIRVLFELARPPLGARLAEEPLDQAAQRAYVRSLRREARALADDVRANGVPLRDVVHYGRVLNGFAATIETEDVARVQALGVRVQRVRRLYPAVTPIPEQRRDRPGDRESRPLTPGVAPGAAAPSVALLDSGVELGHPALRGAVAGLADVVDGDGEPLPGRLAGRREEHGTQTAGVLADELGGRGRVLAIRVASLERDPAGGAIQEVATSDRVIAGLERAVDPDGDGDAADAVAVALVGVNAPYAGFASAPEARAAEAAVALGTLVVAPAGNEGARAGRFGTIGSPAAAPAVLAAGALEGGDAPGLPGVRLGLASDAGRATLDARSLGGRSAAVRGLTTGLAGPSQADPEALGRAAGADPLDHYAADARPRSRGRVVVVPARDRSGRRPALADVASAAAAAGAVALVVCDPDGGEPLQPLPRGVGAGIPVVGVAGDDARRALELTEDDGGMAFVSMPRPRASRRSARVAPASSEGPTYAFEPKPDVLAPGTARAPLAGGGRGFAAGTSVAAARAAAAALALRRARPAWTAAEAAATLAATAAPAPGRAGRAAPPPGIPDAGAAAAAPAIALPRALALPRREPGHPLAARARLTLRNPGERPLELTLAIEAAGAPPGVRLAVPARVRIPAGGRRSVDVVARGRSARAALVRGHVVARAGRGRALRVPLLLPVQPPPPAALGELRLVRDDGRVRGVRFAAGAVRGEDERISVLPLERLTLTLVRASGRRVRELTPRGGARDLLPAEYAYTLTGEALRDLPRGRYRFVASARGPARGERAERESPEFEVR